MSNTNEEKKESVQDKDAKMWAMFCHLSALVGFVIPFGNIIGPLIIWILKKEEYELVNLNGKEALNYLEAMPEIQLIIIDIMMPDMDGMELLKFINASSKWKKIPVIMCTSLADIDVVKKKH